MEQKHLDEVEESFFGEEFIDDDEVLTPKKNTKKEIKIESAKPKKEKKTIKKTTTKKAAKEKTPAVEKPAEPKAKPAPVVKETKVEPAAEKKPVETKPTIDPWDEPENESSMFKETSTWKVIAGIAVILLLFSIFTDGFNFGATGAQAALDQNSLSMEDAQSKVLDYVNTNLLQAPFQAKVDQSSEENGLYKITLDVAGDKVDSYITKDGSLFFPQGFDTTKAPTPAKEQQAAPIANAKVSADDDPVLGQKNAPVTIVEFSDFQCPFCAQFFSQTYKKLKADYVDTGKVKLVFRDFPLENIHPQAIPAAMAAECAQDQGKFWEFHDKLFENQASLSEENYKLWAKELGLNENNFNECLDSKKYESEVRKDMSDGQSYGVSGTPAFFINGKMLSGALPYEEFKEEIDAALGSSGSTPTEQPAPTPVPTPEPVATGKTVQLSMNAKRWIFTPNNLEVNKGDTVRLTITPKDLKFTFAIPNLDVTRKVDGVTTVEFVPNKAGEFSFVCESCEDWRGMKGTIVVK